MLLILVAWKLGATVVNKEEGATVIEFEDFSIHISPKGHPA